ncbi:unnamed protein product [Hermetia illucens]|uniref:Uncharacterized protein n=1 Tax=Hermetia illucens TaxID=343691 RepID=A0A7R8V5W9_HERIL|nr:unnamed protein product [Hermetia illucens]
MNLQDSSHFVHFHLLFAAAFFNFNMDTIRADIPSPLEGSTKQTGSSLYIDPHLEGHGTTNVTTQIGTHAYLPCKVKQLGNKSVSWVRVRDGHILTVDSELGKVQEVIIKKFFVTISRSLMVIYVVLSSLLFTSSVCVMLQRILISDVSKFFHFCDEDDDSFTKVEVLGVLFGSFAKTTIDLLLDLGNFTGNIVVLTIQQWGEAIRNLTRVVEHDYLVGEVSSSAGWTVQCSRPPLL